MRFKCSENQIAVKSTNFLSILRELWVIKGQVLVTVCIQPICTTFKIFYTLPPLASLKKQLVWLI